ncbi:electron transport complex subunit E [bacterium]|nr:electron transport complex subunit E [bacterium]
MASRSVAAEFVKGVWKENPVLRLLLGMCPVLAVTTSVENGLGMGLAATFVLICSNVVVSLLRSIIPARMRIPCFIVVIAAFVTIVDLVLQGFFFELSKSLGVFVPLIVVNCIILGRAEAFAYKNGPFYSMIDAMGMGVGFTLALMTVGTVRELLGNGTWLGFAVPPFTLHPWIIMILPPGAFITLGLLVAGMNWLTQQQEAKRRQAAREARLAKGGTA